MGFPITDRGEAEKFLLEYLELTKTDPDLFAGWRNLGMVVGVKLEDLDLGFTLDCTSGQNVVITPGYPRERPGAALKTTSEVFHNIFCGRQNLMIAFSRRQVKTEGKVSGILKLTPLLPKNIALYKQYLAKKGLSA